MIFKFFWNSEVTGINCRECQNEIWYFWIGSCPVWEPRPQYTLRRDPVAVTSFVGVGPEGCCPVLRFRPSRRPVVCSTGHRGSQGRLGGWRWSDVSTKSDEVRLTFCGCGVSGPVVTLPASRRRVRRCIRRRAAGTGCHQSTGGRVPRAGRTLPASRRRVLRCVRRRTVGTGVVVVDPV